MLIYYLINITSPLNSICSKKDAGFGAFIAKIAA